LLFLSLEMRFLCLSATTEATLFIIGINIRKSQLCKPRLDTQPPLWFPNPKDCLARISLAHLCGGTRNWTRVVYVAYEEEMMWWRRWNTWRMRWRSDGITWWSRCLCVCVGGRGINV
jgi:hypothetical protein